MEQSIVTTVGPRERTDVFWAVLFVLGLLSTFGSGFFFVSQANVAEFNAFMTAPKSSKCFEKLDIHYPFSSKTTNKTLDQVDASGLKTGDDIHNREDKSFWERFLMWIAISAFVCVPLGLLSLEMLRRFPRVITYTTIAIIFVIHVALIIVGLALANILLSVLAMISFVVYSVFLCVAHGKKMKLCAKLMEVAVMGINDNILIIWYNVALKLGYIALSAVLFSQVYFAFMNGHTTINNEVDTNVRYPDGAHEYCLKLLDDEEAYYKGYDYEAVNCCEWNLPSYAVVWIVFAFIFFAWLTSTLAELKSFFTAGSLAQWYYGVAPSGREASNYSLRVAMTSHLGTISLAGLILQIFSGIRRSIRFVGRRQPGLTLICIIFLRIFLEVLEGFTRFSTIYSSIRASSFCFSARQVYLLFMRCSLSTVTFWWVPEAVLAMATFIVSLAWGTIVYLISYEAFEKYGFFLHSQAGDSVLFAVGAFATALIVLTFFSMLVLVAIDTIYVCYAMDLNSNTVNQPEVHEIYKALPIVEHRPGVITSRYYLTTGIPRQGNQTSFVVSGLPVNQQHPSNV